MQLNKKAVLEQAKAIMTSRTLTEAYKKSHPNASHATADANCSDMLKHPAVLKKVEELINLAAPMEVTRQSIIKLYQTILERYLTGQENGANFIRALENLQKLVPDFVDRREVNSYEHMSDEELDKVIKDKYSRLGLN